MKKINLFFILAFREQTYIYDKKVQEINKKLEKNIKIMDTTLTWHYVILSKYFNLYNFYEYQETIEKFENAVIYHLPNGRDNRNTAVEEDLLKFRGKVPIVMRSYDAHSPIKLSSIYMDKYHDLTLTYLNKLVNQENRLFAQLCYDNFLVTKFHITPKHRKFASIILRKENRPEYYEKSENFKEIEIEKTYHLREEYAEYRQIELFGSNWSNSMPNFKGALRYQRKHDIQNQYKFNFIIENAIVDNYLSEKILDTFLSLSVPVYLGSPVVSQYIPKECFIDIRDFKNNDELVKYLENMPSKEYDQYIKNILKHRDTIFDSFSTKNNFVIPVYEWYQKNYNKDLFFSQEDFMEEENRIKILKLKEENKLELFFEKVVNFIKIKM